MKMPAENFCQRYRSRATRAVQAIATFCAALLVAALPAAGPGPSGKNLGDLRIEELMNETVTSVSKHEQRLGDSAAAISVLSNDALRRSGATRLTWRADTTNVEHDHDSFTADNFNPLGRWSRQFSAGAGVEVQAYYDRVSRHEPARADSHSDTVDFVAQHLFGLGERHSVIWGVQVSRRVSADLALFYNEYSKLIGVGAVQRFVPGVPFGRAEMPFVNLEDGETYGGEISLTLSPVDRWRLTASYSRIVVHLRGGPAPTVGDASSPEHQAILQSSYDFNPRNSLEVQGRFVSEIPGVAAYTAADFRLAYRWTEQIEISLVGRNLFDRQHPELALQQVTVTAEVPRAFYGKVT